VWDEPVRRGHGLGRTQNKVLFVMCLANLQTAIAQFAQWEHPWKFYTSVRSALTASDQAQFEAVWQTALATEHWKSTDLQQCAAHAAAAISQAYPGLEAGSVHAIANAAAYRWK
jgi:hypothetical protein